MSIRIVIDMNLSHEWCDVFTEIGWFAVHWSTIGSESAKDQEIMDWARDNKCIVFTHDLDFGTILALSHASGPSVLQVRTRKVLPRHISAETISVIRSYETELETGAIVVIDDSKSRERILPIEPVRPRNFRATQIHPREQTALAVALLSVRHSRRCFG